MKRQHPDNPDLFWCSYCKNYKTLNDTGRRKDGQLNSYCKQCAVERTRIWVQTHKEKYSEWLKTAKPRNNKRKNEDYAKHREKRLKSCAEYHALHPEVHKRANDKYRLINKNEINKKNLERIKVAYKKNPEKYKEKNRTYRDSLNDVYIKTYLNTLAVPITPETIELKRQAITIKRIERSMLNELRQ